MVTSSDVVYEKEVIFQEFDFETSDLEFEVSKSSIWKHTTKCNKGVFSFIIISQLRQPIKLKLSQVCHFMHMLRYTKWEHWSLTILTILSTVFNTLCGVNFDYLFSIYYVTMVSSLTPKLLTNKFNERAKKKTPQKLPS